MSMYLHWKLQYSEPSEAGFDPEYRDHYLVDSSMSKCANHREQRKNFSLFVLVQSPV